MPIEDSKSTPFGRDPDVSESGETVEQKTSHFFVVSLDSSLYAFDATVVDQVAQLETPLPVPTAPAHFEGVVYLRGRLLTVVDVRMLLGLAPAVRSADDVDGRLVVLNARACPFSFLADKVLGLRALDTDAIDSIGAADGHKEQTAEGVVLGQLETEDGVITVLQLEAMVADLLGSGPAPSF